MAHDHWLKIAVGRGLQALITLNLEGKPPADSLPQTADIWLIALQNSNIHWQQEHDEWRIQKGFAVLLSSATKFPVPKNLLDNLPARKQQAALPKPEYPREKALQNLQKIKAMLKEANIGNPNK
jgi:hypothetical protein